MTPAERATLIRRGVSALAQRQQAAKELPMPDWLWHLTLSDYMGQVSAAVNGKGDLATALQNLVDTANTWRVEVAHGRQIVILSDEAKARIWQDIQAQTAVTP